MRRRPLARLAVAVIPLLLFFVLLFSGTALAAEVVGGEAYYLANGQVIDDDLYVTGSEVIIDGTVQGDLIVFGGYVEVNGVVTGDVMVFAAGVVLNGAVQDDARVAGAGVTINGSVGDDLFAAGGGSGLPMGMPFPIQIGNRSIQQGIRFTGNSTVGGDAYIAGGQGTLAGAVQGNLYSGMGALQFGAQVAGDAQLYANQLDIEPASRVEGELRYSSEEPVAVPSEVATTVTEETVSEQTVEDDTGNNLLDDVVWWILRTALLMLGIALVGWILISLRPRLLSAPGALISRQTLEAGLYGILVAALVVPLSAALVFLAVLFWGWFPGGIVMFTFLFGFFSLLWILSPLVAGAWLGPHIVGWFGRESNTLVDTLVGALAIVLVARAFTVVPCVGGVINVLTYLLSFALAAGGIVLLMRTSASAQPADDGIVV